MKSNKGVKFNDRVLAGTVRSMGLSWLQTILSDDYDDKDFQKQVVLKIAASLLPRLNEHTGEDGGKIQGSWTVTFQDGSSIS